MTISVFDLFSVGVGPSSSHTVGPMRAAGRFLTDLCAGDHLDDTTDVRVDLYASLAATGAGHGTMSAILLGLEGLEPETVDTDDMEKRLAEIRKSGHVRLAGRHLIPLTEQDIVLRPLTSLPFHPNAMTLTAVSASQDRLHSETYYSIGGGFVVTEKQGRERPALADDKDAPGRIADSDMVSFGSAEELLELTELRGESISEVMLAYESAAHTADEVRDRLLHIRDVMVECENRGITRGGELPGSLRVRRRAKDWYERLTGIHRVSLDQVIETMKTTGADMNDKYKETSTGGLAINVPVNHVEC